LMEIALVNPEATESIWKNLPKIQKLRKNKKNYLVLKPRMPF
jgi:uncharacterized protein YrzB (UPF0473 family)